MFLQLNNVFVAVNHIYKKHRPSVRRQFAFSINNFLRMPRLGFSNKVPGQSIFREATSRSLVMVMFRYMLIAAIICFRFTFQ